MYAARLIAAALYSWFIIGVVLIVGLIRLDTTCEVSLSVLIWGGGIAGTNVTATRGRFGIGGIAGRDGMAGRDGPDGVNGVGFIPGIVRLDGASSRLNRRKLHWSFPYRSMQGWSNIYFLLGNNFLAPPCHKSSGGH